MRVNTIYVHLNSKRKEKLHVVQRKPIIKPQIINATFGNRFQQTEEKKENRKAVVQKREGHFPVEYRTRHKLRNSCQLTYKRR